MFFFRFYGEILRENSDSLVIDTVIFALLAEKGFGPKLYGVFQGGRLEQYINVRDGMRILV